MYDLAYVQESYLWGLGLGGKRLQLLRQEICAHPSPEEILLASVFRRSWWGKTWFRVVASDGTLIS